MYVLTILKNSIRTASISMMVAFALAVTVRASAAPPINIGILAPESNIVGKGIVNGAKLAAEQINAKGGIDGRQVQLHVYDTNYSTSNAARAFQRAVERDHAVAVVGIFTTEVASAMMPWAARLKTPLIITASSSPHISERVRENPKRFKYVFHTFNDGHDLARQSCMDIKFLRSHKKFQGFKTAVILAEDLAWTKPAVTTYKKCLPHVGVNVVNTIVFARSTSDFTPIFQKIKSEHADMIVTALAVTGTRVVVQWHRQQVPALLVGINAQSTPSNFWKATAGAANGVISQNVALRGTPITAKTPVFYAAYSKEFDVDTPVFSAYSTYDAMSMLFDALKRADAKGGDALVSALAKTDMVGTLGRLRFHGLNDKKAHETYFSMDPKVGQSFVGFQWQDGRQVVIFPKALAEGQPQLPPFVPMPK